jgi:NADPH-dependent 2,4-dienoyl-CoA reductase/sulfur reductase-like enzyme
VTCFQVEEQDGMLFVRNPIEPQRSAYDSTSNDALQSESPTQSNNTPQSIVIVGAGASGVAAAEMLRRSGYGGEIHLLDAQTTLPVDRPNLSKDYLAGTAQEEWVNLRSADFYKEHHIDLVLGTRVSRIDTKRRVVETQNGTEYPFDRLLLATGAEPVRLDIPGAQLPHVHYLRSLDDSRSIIEAAKHAKRAVVIGASFIGLEVAASLRARGLTVDVVAPEQRPLVRVLGDALGDMIRKIHEEHAVTFHLQTTVTQIDAKSVRTSSNETIDADIVVIGIGVRPVVALAEQAGLTVDNGVVVNKFLETSIPGIYAAGDIARWPDPRTNESVRVEHWVVAERLGQTAARNMLGQTRAFDDVPFFWSQHYDVVVNYSGHAKQWDATDVDGDPDTQDCKVTYRAGKKTLAVATVGRDLASLQAEHTLEMQSGS